MRWPWQRRPAVPARHALPRQAARWAEPAMPPPISAAVPVAPAMAPAQAAGVALGFADGSQVFLEDSSPTAVALRAVADALISRPGG